MKINVTYKSSETEYIKDLVSESDIVNLYDLDSFKEKKNGHILLNKYGTKMTPFVEILNDEGNYVKHLYSEENNITIELILKTVNKFKK